MRTARKQSESETYHVISRGTGRQLIFEDDDDREAFLGLLGRHAEGQSIGILAWCLMGNHFHLLLRAPMERISLCMKSVCGLYAQRFNRKHGRTGHLFQERFKSEPIGDEAYLAVVVSYIHYNPEKAGIADYRSYPWSSYGEYVGRGGAHSICEKEAVLGCLGGIDGFVKFHEARAADAQAMDVDSLRSATRSMSDEGAIALAREVLGGRRLADLKALSRPERDESLGRLLAAGLSIRQIERLTGIGRGVIQSLSRRGTR